MDKNSFLMYLDYEEQFNLLTDKQIGQLMRAVIKYEKTGEEPEISDGMVKMSFSFIKTQLDRDREKYTVQCKKNKENARKRWNAKNATAYDGIRIDAKYADNEDDDEDDNDNEDVVVQEKLQQQFIKCTGSTNLNAIDECISYLNDLPYEVVVKALEKISGINKPNWQYAKSILDNWVKLKIDTIEKIEAEDKNFRKSRDGPKKSGTMKNFEQREYQNLNKLYTNGGK